jgi:hypothetical protein
MGTCARKRTSRCWPRSTPRSSQSGPPHSPTNWRTSSPRAPSLLASCRPVMASLPPREHPTRATAVRSRRGPRCPRRAAPGSGARWPCGATVVGYNPTPWPCVRRAGVRWRAVSVHGCAELLELLEHLERAEHHEPGRGRGHGAELGRHRGRYLAGRRKGDRARYVPGRRGGTRDVLLVDLSERFRARSNS